MIKAVPPWQAPIVTVTRITDPEELAELNEIRRKGDINSEAFERFAPEIYRNMRDKFVCVAGGQLFSGDTADEVLAASHAAFPDDNATVFRYVPKQKLVRIY